MRKILRDIARHLIVHMYSFRTSFDILPLFAKLGARKLSGAALPYPSGTYFRRYSEKAATARLAQFIPGLLCVGPLRIRLRPESAAPIFLSSIATRLLADDVTMRRRRHIFNKQCARPKTAKTSPIGNTSSNSN